MDRTLDDRERIILETIRHSPTPLGAWNLVDLLARKGVNVGPSTVGRALNYLEKRGYLSKDNVNQGRTITDQGKALLDRIEHQQMLRPLSEQLGEALNTKALGKYLMVLEARKAIERATVRLAARNITDEELRELESIVSRREESLQKSESITPHDIAFHSLIAAASRNEVLSLLYQTIATQGQQSRRFELLRKRVSAPSQNAHREIVAALKRRDADLAEECIARHLDTLMRNVEQYWHEFLD